MKRVIAAGVLLLLLLFILPVLIVQRQTTGAGEREPGVLPATPSPVAAEEPQPEGTDRQTPVRLLDGDGQIREVTMAEYLWSVTAAEMPASFEAEALKAQAVTARTYTAWKMAAGEAKHPQADVCTDINCCQAYISREEAAAIWGAQAEFYTEKIEAAVSETDGIVMTYEGQPIQAVFFSSADGRTEDAVAVWGNSVPYLVGVESPEGEDVPNYHTTVTFTAQEFRDAFLQGYPGADLTGAPEGWFANLTHTASGRVATLDVGGITVKGTALRALLGLRSASFAVETGVDSVTFSVTGYGHGVGMSQYGANTMARQGSSWREILTWYYTGVEFRQ